MILISKADSIAPDKILFSKLLGVSEVFWSFTCIFKSKLFCTLLRLAKYQTEMLLCIAKEQFRSRGQIKSKVSSKKTPWLDTNDQKFNCNNADGHSQTGNLKKNQQVEFKRQAEEQKQWGVPWDCLHTVAY